MKVLVAFVLALAAASSSRVAFASPALDLVASARSHVARGDDDLAIQRYLEAISIEPSCEPAYLGLGALREKHGEVREAERVYNAALSHLPASSDARMGRARALWALGFAADAARDVEEVGATDAHALRQLALWYMTAANMPAALAVWREILTHARAQDDADLAREARTQIRALALVVITDPVAHPVDATATRRALTSIAAQR